MFCFPQRSHEIEGSAYDAKESRVSTDGCAVLVDLDLALSLWRPARWLSDSAISEAIVDGSWPELIGKDIDDATACCGTAIVSWRRLFGLLWACGARSRDMPRGRRLFGSVVHLPPLERSARRSL